MHSTIESAPGLGYNQESRGSCLKDGKESYYAGGSPEGWVTPTPLSDPVFNAIFQNAEVSALAMRSFINATLEDSGDRPISEVVSVTPQSVHSSTSPRGFRIDVEAKAENGEVALVEVQLKPLTEVVEMDPDLQKYCDIDPGFAQFVERHGRVAALPDMLKAYRRWEIDLACDNLDEERRNAEIEERLATSEAKGIDKGIAKSQMENAIKILTMMKQGSSSSEVYDMLKLLDIPNNIIVAAKKQIAATEELNK